MNEAGGRFCFPEVVRRARLALGLALAFFPLVSAAGSIFDDDYIPPARAEAVPQHVTPTPKPATPSDTPKPAPSVKPTPAPVKPAPDVVVPSPSPDANSSHRGIPDRDSRAKCRKLFEEAYSAELKDRTPAARKKLAQQLLAEGIKTPAHSADKFVLLTGAMQAAADAQNIRIGFAAAAELARAFDLDALPTKVDVAVKVFAGAPSPTMATVYNVESLFTLADQLAAEDDFPDLAKVEAALQHGSAGAIDSDLKSAIKNQAREMAVQRDAHDKIQPALDKLKKSPDEPAPNDAVGRYLCFQRGQWESGLPLLAKSNDAMLKSLATSELRGPSDSEAIATLADGWFSEAARLAGPDRLHVQEHAAGLYRKAEVGLTGLKKLTAEKRLAEIPTSGRHRRIDLIDLWDTAKIALDPGCKIENSEILCDNKGVAHFLFPYTPPEEYEYRISFQVLTMADGIGMNCYANGHQFAWHPTAWTNTVSAFNTIAGMAGNLHSTSKKVHLVNGQHYVAAVRVRKSFVEAYLNDQLLASWKTDYSDLSVTSNWAVSQKDAIGLVISSGTIRIDLAEIVEITGQGKVATQ